FCRVGSSTAALLISTLLDFFSSLWSQEWASSQVRGCKFSFVGFYCSPTSSEGLLGSSSPWLCWRLRTRKGPVAIELLGYYSSSNI
ncbi:unnamed protein product, partial [Musa acuminata var. zebrina]